MGAGNVLEIKELSLSYTTRHGRIRALDADACFGSPCPSETRPWTR